MRLRGIFVKELLCIKENVAFNVVTIISPLLFLFAFSLMLSGGISLPVQVFSDDGTSVFLEDLLTYNAPDGSPYLLLTEASSAVPPSNADSDLIVVKEEPRLREGVFSGKIQHYLNDANENMTKNFRNRLSGAMLQFSAKHFEGSNIQVSEHTVYDGDIAWDTGFGVSVFVFALVLSGLLFGLFSITGEWENRTMKLLRLAPCRPGTVVVGKLCAGLFKCFVSMAIYLCIFFLISGHFPVQMFAFFSLFLILSAIFVCLGMIIGIYVQSTLTGFLLSLALSLMFWVGGGGFGPLSYFGEVANFLGSLNPATYGIDIVRWCYFEGAGKLVFGFTFLFASFLALFFAINASYTRLVRSEEGR
ncbi:MAG: ABC transporter permease [Bradymonadales bacterium]